MWLEDDLGGRTGPSVAYFVNPVMVELPPRVGKISFLLYFVAFWMLLLNDTMVGRARCNCIGI